MSLIQLFRIPLPNTVSHCWFLMKRYFPTASDNYLDLSNYEGWNFNSGNYLFTTDTK